MHRVKAGWAVRIDRVVRRAKLSQAAAVEIKGIDQPKVSIVMDGHFGSPPTAHLARRREPHQPPRFWRSRDSPSIGCTSRTVRSNRWLLDRLAAGAAKPVFEAEKGRQALIDGKDLTGRQFAEHAADPPLVDGSKVIDQRE